MNLRDNIRNWEMEKIVFGEDTPEFLEVPMTEHIDVGDYFAFKNRAYRTDCKSGIILLQFAGVPLGLQVRFSGAKRCTLIHPMGAKEFLHHNIEGLYHKYIRNENGSLELIFIPQNLFEL